MSCGGLWPTAALKIILAPAWVVLLQLAAVFAAVLSLLVIILGFFIGTVRDPMDTRYVYTTLQIQAVVAAAERYRADCGDYPTVSQGLNALVSDPGVNGWRGPYVRQAPLDPWGRPFVYRRAGGSNTPEIVSYAADGKPGGGSLDDVISSKNLKRPTPQNPRVRWAHRLMVATWIAACACLIASMWFLARISRRALRRSA